MSQGLAKSDFIGRTEGDKKVHPFRGNVEAGMPVVCPSCGKTGEMERLGNRGSTTDSESRQLVPAQPHQGRARRYAG